MLCSTFFWKLCNHVFDNHNISKQINMMVYISVCLTTVLYGSEVWVTYGCTLRNTKNSTNVASEKILCIRWEDRHSNASVLMEANITNIEAMIVEN